MSLNTSPARNSDNYLSGGAQQLSYSTNPQLGINPAGDPTAARLASVGVNSGAVPSFDSLRGSIINSLFAPSSSTVFNPENDWRVRVSLQPGLAKLFYNDPANLVLEPLRQTSGVIFPYTPQISVTHNAKYSSATPTHSNYSSYFYENSDIQSINITGDFTVQNIQEGQYLLAVIHFFRSVTKMFYGKDQLAGAPPPMVFLNGYGTLYFPNVSCVVTQFTHQMGSDVDYVEIPVGVNLNNYAGNAVDLRAQSVVRLPTTSQLTVVLQPVYSRKNIANNFSLQGFARGQLLSRVGTSGSISGGFI